MDFLPFIELGGDPAAISFTLKITQDENGLGAAILRSSSSGQRTDSQQFRM
jgi:hypothetical protein